jgi:hypothetical protein
LLVLLLVRQSQPPQNPRKKPNRNLQGARPLSQKRQRSTSPPPRINAIYYELLSLAVEQYPNACAVLLRVFVELSIDHFGEEYKLPFSLVIRSLSG